MLAIDVFPDEDGYAGERGLLNAVLDTVVSNDVWVSDRNMCTRSFLFGIAQKQAFFVIRQHLGMSWTPLDQLGGFLVDSDLAIHRYPCTLG